MPDAGDNNFFSLLANTDGGAPSSSAASGDVFVRDASGRLQVLRNGKFVVDESAAPAAVASPVASVAPSTSSPASSPAPDPLATQIEKLSAQFSAFIPQPELQSRLAAILRSRLKGIRNSAQFRELLVRAVAEGGMGLPADQAEKIVTAVASVVQPMDGLPPLPSAPRPLPPKPIAVPKPQATPVVPIKTAPALLEPIPEPKELPAPIPQKSASAPTAPMRPSVPTPAPSAPQSVPTPIVAPIIPPKPTPLPTTSRLTGPIQELEFMTLEDFRRLGTTPLHMVEKVWQMIQLLGAESFGKKIEGITAWKRSPVNRLYLSLGDDSMIHKLPIKEVIAQRTASQQPSLTEAEFEAILDLNRRLRT